MKRKAAADLLSLFNANKLRFFATRDVATLADISPQAAAQALGRLAKKDLVARLRRGVWVNLSSGDISPYEAVSYLRPQWPSYISLSSALADYGVIEEIPHVIYVISSGQPVRIKNRLGEFHFHYLPPRLIWGQERRAGGRGGYEMADKEKAFLDLVYLALTPRSPLSIPVRRTRRWKLDKSRLRQYARRFRVRKLTKWLEANHLI